jgi:adhesin HecA-like repeat protein
LTGYEAESVAEVEAVLDDSPADSAEVYLRTMGQSERAIAAVAAKRAGGGGGGGIPDPVTDPIVIETAAGSPDSAAALTVVAPTNGDEVAAFLDSLDNQNGVFVGANGDVNISSDGTKTSVTIASQAPGNHSLNVVNGSTVFGGGTTLGFYGATAATQPVVPMTTPSVQDVIDALVVLGLVAQHD